MFVMDGSLSTVTVTVNADPVQVPAVGVMVYVAVCGLFVGLVRLPEMLEALEPDAPPVIPPVTVGADHE